MQNDEDGLMMFSAPRDQRPPGSLMLCFPHDTDLREMLAAEGLGGEDPYIRGAQILIRLAVSTIGSDSLLQYGDGCPICGLKAFPYIRGVVDALLPPKRPD